MGRLQFFASARNFCFVERNNRGIDTKSAFQNLNCIGLIRLTPTEKIIPIVNKVLMTFPCPKVFHQVHLFRKAFSKLARLIHYNI